MNTWIFQNGILEGNLEKELFENKIVRWVMNRYENEIILGDRAIIWRAGGYRPEYGGIIGVGKIIRQEVLSDLDSRHCIVDIEIEELRFSREEGMILINTLKNVPELQHLNKVQQGSSSAFKVSDLEASYIEDMWDSGKSENGLYSKKIVNLNSSIHLDTLVENYCISKLGYLNNTQINEEPIKDNNLTEKCESIQWRNVNYWEEVEVYLVAEELMDEIAPVKNNLSINMEYAKRILADIPNILECKEDAIDELWNRIIKNTSYMKVMGVYIEHVNEELIHGINREHGIKVREHDVIFICSERVMYWCNNDADRFHIAFCMLLIHKLTHFYINFNRRINMVCKNDHNEAWGKFFEESLANILAYKRFNCFEKREIRKLILKKPAEYRACIYWISRDDIEMRNIALAWSRMDEIYMTKLLIDDSSRGILINEFGKYEWKRLATSILKKI